MAQDKLENTKLLADHVAGDQSAADQLMELVYEELRTIASRLMRGERQNHTLCATALVNEAYLKLIDQSRIDWKGQTHFKAMAAITMRRVLINYAVYHRAEKRGKGKARISLEDGSEPSAHLDMDILDLNAALERLEKLHPRQASVVVQRFFGGMGVEETAAYLSVSPGTVKGDWRAARAWLLCEMDRSSKGEEEASK